MKAKRKFQQSDEMSLNITALADVFVILLVFLLKSYASGLNISTSQNMSLANAVNTDEAALPGLKVEITKEGVFLEGVKTVGFDLTRKPSSEESPIYPELQKGLSEARQKRDFLKDKGAAVQNEKEILIVSDKEVPYLVVKKVLTTAATEGFSDAKLAVVRE